jgi:predicted Rossmann fold flavoprotein
MNIAIIGGGAAGFFAAINCAELHPEYTVTIFEKSNKLLTKVRISGGGRCNVTHACFDPSQLTEYYPRGKKELRGVFSKFNAQHTVEWFAKHGVQLKTEADGRMFPVTDDSATIVNCLMEAADRAGVNIRLQHALEKIERKTKGFILHFQNGETHICNKIIVTTGGSPHQQSYSWLNALNHTIVPPVPSLFTFNIPASPLKGLEGIALDAAVSIADTKFSFKGPVLITHWGLSGPAVIKLSAFAARWLHENKYQASININWLQDQKPEECIQLIMLFRQDNGRKKVVASSAFNLPHRLWQRLCELSGIDEQKNYADLNNKQVKELSSNLTSMKLLLSGKTTYKEEFVTCGGVNLKEVNMQTMESKIVPGLFFAGEVLDIDGVTGGFNFQSAWSTAFIAAQGG